MFVIQKSKNFFAVYFNIHARIILLDNTLSYSSAGGWLVTKKLFLLLPFYVMRYEKDIEGITENSEKLRKTVSEYKEIVERMEKAFRHKTT